MATGQVQLDALKKQVDALDLRVQQLESGLTGLTTRVSTLETVRTGPILNPVGYKTLAFEDHFNGTALDASKWYVAHWAIPDTKNESKDIAANKGVVNLNLRRNVSVGGGCLRIASKKENYTTTEIDPGTVYNWTSGCVTTVNKFFVKPPYYLEMRVQQPQGEGMWVALWTSKKFELGQPWQEVDMCEYLGREPFRYYATLHNPDSGPSQPILLAAEDPHTYGVLYDLNHAEWYLDGQKVHEKVVSGIQPVEMYVLVTASVGGSWGGTPNFVEAETLVDYVRVYTP